MNKEDIQSILNEEQCRDIVEKRLKRNSMTGFSFVSYEIIPLDKTLGLMGQYYNLKTIVTDKSSNDTKIIDFFVKIPPTPGTPFANFNEEQKLYTKEVDLYTTAFPKIFHELKNDAIIPECFLGLRNKIIVLEDMTQLGYVMIDKFISLDLNHCTVVMKAFAKIHAKSMIYEIKNKTNIGEEFAYCLYETVLTIGESIGKSGIKVAIKGIFVVIDLITDISECNKKKLKEKILLAVDGYSWLLPSKKFKNVLSHGDSWTNNILFKYNSEKEPINCCFVDFQYARYCPPANDIWYFLQTATTHKFRDDHANELFKIYHQNLTAFLTEAGLDCDTIIPWLDFQKSIDEYRTVSMIHGIVHISIGCLEQQAIDEFYGKDEEKAKALLLEDKSPLICSLYKNSKVFRDRMTDSVIELHDRLINFE